MAFGLSVADEFQADLSIPKQSPSCDIEQSLLWKVRLLGERIEAVEPRKRVGLASPGRMVFHDGIPLAKSYPSRGAEPSYRVALSDHEHRFERFRQGGFWFRNIFSGDVLSPSIDVTAVAFPGEFTEGLGRLESHGDVSIFKFTSKEELDLFGWVAAECPRRTEFDVVAWIGARHGDEDVGGQLVFVLPEGSDEGHAYFFVFVF